MNIDSTLEGPSSEEFHRLRLKLSKDKEFSAQEQVFELLEICPTGYLVAMNYGRGKGAREGDEAALAQSPDARSSELEK